MAILKILPICKSHEGQCLCSAFLQENFSIKVVDKVLCSERLASANCLESNNQDLWMNRKEKLVLYGKFVVKMYWLEEQDFLDCRSEALAGLDNSA